MHSHGGHFVLWKPVDGMLDSELNPRSLGQVYPHDVRAVGIAVRQNKTNNAQHTKLKADFPQPHVTHDIQSSARTKVIVHPIQKAVGEARGGTHMHMQVQMQIEWQMQMQVQVQMQMQMQMQNSNANANANADANTNAKFKCKCWTR